MDKDDPLSITSLALGLILVIVGLFTLITAWNSKSPPSPPHMFAPNSVPIRYADDLDAGIRCYIVGDTVGISCLKVW